MTSGASRALSSTQTKCQLQVKPELQAFPFLQLACKYRVAKKAETCNTTAISASRLGQRQRKSSREETCRATEQEEPQ